MKKLTKQVISLILVGCLLLMFPTVVCAESNSLASATIVEQANGSVILHDSISNISIIAYDLANGNCVFEQYSSNQVVSRHVVDRGKNVLRSTYYDSGVAINEQKQYYVSSTILAADSRGVAAARLGKIRFQYTSDEQSGICGAYVDYVKTTGVTTYDVNGTYRDLASLAAFIASVLALPSAPALGIAKEILNALGIGLSATSFIIPACNLTSNYETVKYTLTNMNSSSHTNSFQGTKYTITQPGLYLNKVYKEGTYYPTTSWNNVNFGTTIYNHMFSYSMWTIYAWN